MAKAPRKTIPKKSGANSTMLMLIDISSRFGLSGMIIFVVVFTFFYNGTSEQKKEFIDKFILLKFPKEEQSYVYFALILIVIVFVSTLNFYRNRLKIKEERIEELTKDIDKLHSVLLK